VFIVHVYYVDTAFMDFMRSCLSCSNHPSSPVSCSSPAPPSSPFISHSGVILVGLQASIHLFAFVHIRIDIR